MNQYSNTYNILLYLVASAIPNLVSLDSSIGNPLSELQCTFAQTYGYHSVTVVSEPVKPDIKVTHRQVQLAAARKVANTHLP